MKTKMSYNDAMVLARCGHAVARRSWANGVFVYSQVESRVELCNVITMTSVPQRVKALMLEQRKHLSFWGFVNFFANGEVCPYKPTPADRLSKDWYCLTKGDE